MYCQRCGQDRETTRRQERKRAQEMLRFPLDVRCVRSQHARLLPCFPTSVLEGVRKRKKPALSRHVYLDLGRKLLFWSCSCVSLCFCDAGTSILPKKDLSCGLSFEKFGLTLRKNYFHLSTGGYLFLEHIFSFFYTWKSFSWPLVS